MEEEVLCDFEKKNFPSYLLRKAVTLMECDVTKYDTGRHCELIKSYLQRSQNGFMIYDLFHLSQLLGLLANRIAEDADESSYRDILRSILNIVKIPPVMIKTSDVLTYERDLQEYFTAIELANSVMIVEKKHSLRPGARTALTKDEELSLCSGIVKAAEWGFPLTRMDIRMIVKQFLDAQGERVRRFKENMPGFDWFYTFFEKKSCFNGRVDSLSENVQDVPACNVINYDQTNLCDDPGKSKVVCKSGMKYVNRILDASKCSTTIMVSATGSGKLLPVYVVYRAQHLYPTWTENGPDNAVYNRTKSGWFEGTIFEDWFEEVALPYFRKCEDVVLKNKMLEKATEKSVEMAMKNWLRHAKDRIKGVENKVPQIQNNVEEEVLRQ